MLLILAVTALAVGSIRLDRLGKDYTKRCAADLEDEWYRRISADLEDEWRRQEEKSNLRDSFPEVRDAGRAHDKEIGLRGRLGRLRRSGDRQSSLEAKGQRL